jgi:hypothetical protein
MKHLTLAALCLLASLFTISCKTQSGAATTVSASKGSVKGTWVVTDISFDGIPQHSKVTVFDQASYECFKGSQWVFPNNETNGSYTLTSTEGGCSTASQPIVWSIYKSGGVENLQFKKIGGGVKSKDVAEGYRLEISSLDKTTMVWRAAVNFEGKTGYIVYTLQRG